MIIDKTLQVSNEQAVTATAASTDVIDFGQTNPDVGMDGMSKLVITVDEAAASAGATTVDFALQDSADNSSFSTISQVSAVPKATLTAGYQIVIPMPTKVRRYARVYFTVNTANLTAGKFSAAVVTGITQNTAKPDSSRIA